MPEAKFVSGIIIHSVYNPHIESAERFARKFELEVYTDDSERFFENVDAVYVASPHETHYAYTKAALGAWLSCAV